MVDGTFGRKPGLHAWKGSRVINLIQLTQKHHCNHDPVYL
jgi:hypothetical protein